MIVRTDIFIMPVLHEKAIRDRAQLYKSQPLIQVSRVDIVFHDCIKLKDPEPKPFPLDQAILDQLLPDMSPPAGGTDRIAGIADMAAAAHVIGMQDIKSYHISGLVLRHPIVGLGGKELLTDHSIKEVQLGKGNPLLNDLIPYFDHGRQIFLLVFSDDHSS